MRAAIIIALGALAIGTVFQADAQTTAVDPSRLHGLTQRAPTVPRVGTLVSQGASLLADKARDAQTAAKLRTLWPSVANSYRYLGNDGLLIRMPVYVLKVADPSLPRSKVVGDVSIVGAGASPAAAWATAGDMMYGAPSEDYALSQEDSRFLWVTPGRNGWPKQYPSYAEAAKAGLMQRRTPWEATVGDGVALRSQLQADTSLEETTRYQHLVTSLESAETNAATEVLRRSAMDLHRSAEEDLKRLAQINKQLSDDQRAVERAQVAADTLQGIFRVGALATNTADALSELGPDAPRDPTGAIKTNLSPKEASDLVDGFIKNKSADVKALNLERADVTKRLDGTTAVTVETFKGVILPPPK